MKKKIKYYHLYGTTEDKEGLVHIVTVVGKFEQTRKQTEVKESINIELRPKAFTEGELKYKVKMLHRKLTIGLSICHPQDKFNEEYGVKLAKSRIDQGRNVGEIYTNDVTMLTEDAIYGELLIKLQHVCNNIDDYIY